MTRALLPVQERLEQSGLATTSWPYNKEVAVWLRSLGTLAVILLHAINEARPDASFRVDRAPLAVQSSRRRHADKRLTYQNGFFLFLCVFSSFSVLFVIQK